MTTYVKRGTFRSVRDGAPVFTMIIAADGAIEPPRVFHQSEDRANVFARAHFYEISCGEYFARADSNGSFTMCDVPILSQG